MNLATKRFGLVLAGVIGVGAIASLAIGASFALFSSTALTQNNSVIAGTLNVTAGAGTSATFNTPVLEPGPRNGVDTQALGSYVLDYSGTINGFVGLDFSITSTASQPCSYLAGATGTVASDILGDCSNTGSLPLYLGATAGGSDGVTLTVNENGSSTPNNSVITNDELLSATSCSSTAGVVTCTATIDDIELPSAVITSSTSNGEWTNGDSDTLSLNIWLPPTAGNQFQGGTASVTLTGHGVQYDNNNGTPPSCASGTNLYYPNPTTCPTSWS